MTGRTILLSVGTDHHPFDRAVHWADQWAADHPEDTVVVQHGASTAPRRAEGHDYVAPQLLTTLMTEADVVITHGGPGTIAAARSAGHLPFVLPRDPNLGEHVDDHQMRFSNWADERGLGRRCSSLDDLTAAVASATASAGTRSAAEAADDRVVESSHRLAKLLDADGRRAVSTDAPTVVYLGGFGRSGSTLLERLLGALDGTVALGEVVHLWNRGLGSDELCGCGTQFSRCPFWNRVGELAFDGWGNVDLTEVRRLHDAVDRQRRTLVTMLPSTPLSVRKDLIAYTTLYRAIYDAALEISGAQVVIDSSKHASLAIALGHDRHIDLRVLHVVRDPRAVAHSWAREVARPESRGDTTMPQFSASRAAGLWMSNNALIEAVRFARSPMHVIRYEDLVDRPQEQIDAAWGALGLPGSSALPLSGPRTIDLEPIHSVAGNPMRFRSGPTTLRADREWEHAMPTAQRQLVTALTAPLLLRYGYRL